MSSNVPYRCSLLYPLAPSDSGLHPTLPPTRVSCADTTTRRFFVFVQNRAANVGTNCMPSRACHSCILCTDRTLCRSAPGLNLCLMARYEARSCISRQSDRDSPLRARRIPSDSWNAPFTLRHPRIIYVFRVLARNCHDLFFIFFKNCS